MSDVKYKIIELNEAEHSIVVRFYTDIVTENMLACEWGDGGVITRCRTDYSITLPVPAPRGDELNSLIMRHAPVDFFEVKAKVENPAVDASLEGLRDSLGVERVASAESSRTSIESVPLQMVQS